MPAPIIISLSATQAIQLLRLIDLELTSLTGETFNDRYEGPPDAPAMIVDSLSDARGRILSGWDDAADMSPPF